MTTLDECHGEGARDGGELPGEVSLGLVESAGPAVVPLDQPGAALPRLAGSKAANLARAARAGLPVLPGFVIPHQEGGDLVALRRAWHELSDGGARPLVVRSSSPQEDTDESSLAGQFASVLDVRDWRDFRTAVRTVLDSAHRPDGSTAPMAVLVQPMLTARVGGVMFGADPVEGRADRMLVSAVRGGPDSLVSGEQAGTNYWLSERGRVLRTEPPETGAPSRPAGPSEARALSHLAEPSEARALTHLAEPSEARALTHLAEPSKAGALTHLAEPSEAGALTHLAEPSEARAAAVRARHPEAGGPPFPAEHLEEAGAPPNLAGHPEADAPHSPAKHFPAKHPKAGTPPDLAEHPEPGAQAAARTAPPETGSLLTRTELFRLARLARHGRRIFGGPQDMEFGFDEDGRLWLFQSRPITAMAARPARRARLLGPGPVAETLPEQLQPLEEDLWVAPMARGIATALDIGGTVPRRLLRTVPVVTTVGGRAAADLLLLGAVAPRHRWLALLNPAPGARRLGAAWRVGRLRGALPGLATDLVADVDRRLTEIPPPAGLAGPDLAAELRWTRTLLVSLHAQEALAGALLSDEPQHSRTAAGAALAALAEARTQGIPDDRVVAANPLVLALTAPSLRGRGRLPQAVAPSRDGVAADRAAAIVDESGLRTTGTHLGATATATNRSATPTPISTPATEHPAPRRSPTAATAALPPREALRLRIRWVQELQVRLVREVARRVGLDVERVGLLRWRELVAVLEGGALPGDLHARVPQAESAPLPDTFRLAEGKVVVAERDGDRGDGVRGVSGGRAVGTVWDGSGRRPADAVLVVRSLDPALAPLLPRLTGLVAQTGSPLSHLAVLAREFGLPAVVGAKDAVRRFPSGSRLTIDGTTGDIRLGDAP
ncbi:PEP/pyruvate-binding domain-containing protein [Streptomyces sp. NPDC050619]|uniref:PEP/pyruvate-binding domain-containing protein n=1 Tax=Streptomyces sp. NPDC050619 TaxID=3157214 RepID=UPI00342985B5